MLYLFFRGDPSPRRAGRDQDFPTAIIAQNGFPMRRLPSRARRRPLKPRQYGIRYQNQWIGAKNLVRRRAFCIISPFVHPAFPGQDLPMSDPSKPNRARRKLIIASACAGGAAAVGTAVPFAASMLPSERAEALGAPVEADVSPLAPGEKMTVEWRGQPVWILRRTKEMLEGIKKAGPEAFESDWTGGFYCPCHGSLFDLAGRVYRNKPAPDNLRVPPYTYLSDTRILIGEDKKGA